MKQQTIQNLENALPPISPELEFANDNAQDIFVGDSVMHICANGEIHFGRVVQITRRAMMNAPDQYLVQFKCARRLCGFASLQKFTEV